ncbi:MAG: uroporphyrinogen-III synthase [Pseudomonadota bacterium]
MNILITRPEPEASELAATLNQLGHHTLVDPMLHIEFLVPDPVNFSVAQAIMFTSANGIRGAKALTIPTSLPTYVVGSATAQAAQHFKNIYVSNGGALELCQHIVKDLNPAKGPLIHFSGRHTAIDIQHTLQTKGFCVEKYIVYEAKPARQFAPETLQALAGRTIQSVLFFSPRSAAIFAKLLIYNKQTIICRSMTAICFSQNVAGALQGTTWKELRVTQRPQMECLLSLLNQQENV